MRVYEMSKLPLTWNNISRPLLLLIFSTFFFLLSSSITRVTVVLSSHAELYLSRDTLSETDCDNCEGYTVKPSNCTTQPWNATPESLPIIDLISWSWYRSLQLKGGGPTPFTPMANGIFPAKMGIHFCYIILWSLFHHIFRIKRRLNSSVH